MNIVDYCILGVIGASVLFGLYFGFISSVLNTGGSLISFGASFWLSPKLAGLIQQNPQLQRTLLSYTDAERRLGDLGISAKKVAVLTKDEISRIVERANLPGSLGSILRSNLENEIFNGIDDVASYVSETIVMACINIICFLIVFVLLYIVFSLVISAVRSVAKLPVLKQFDRAFGGLFGFLRGLLFVYAFFTLVPLAQTVVRVDAVTELIEQSSLAALFNSGSLITAVMNGSLFGGG